MSMSLAIICPSMGGHEDAVETWQDTISKPWPIRVLDETEGDAAGFLTAQGSRSEKDVVETKAPQVQITVRQTQLGLWRARSSAYAAMAASPRQWPSRGDWSWRDPTPLRCGGFDFHLPVIVGRVRRRTREHLLPHRHRPAKCLTD